MSRAKELIKSEKTRKIPISVQRDANDIGYSIYELIDFFLTLEKKDFFKSETQFTNHKIWQDYYSKFDGKIYIFIKFKIIEDNTVVIVTSFKEDTNK